MPIQKDLKRRVRERMAKTGESYTAARARLLERRKAARTTEPTVDLAALGGMRDEALRAKTGKGWAEWVAVLDRFGAAAKPHRDVARHLAAVHGLPSWWSQTVTVGYERIRGLRQKGQRIDGRFDVGKSKTYPVPQAALWTAFGRCKQWIGDVDLRMSKATKPKTMRLRWTDGTPLDVYFVAKGPRKSQLQVQHRGRASRAEAEALRVFWTERLAALGEFLKTMS